MTKDYSATGAIGFFGDLAKGVLDIGAGAVGGALGVIIGLGSEIGQVFGDLGLGGTFGVIGGVVIFAVGGSIVLAVVAGVGIGAVTNELLQQRPLSSQEAQFATSLRQLAALRSDCLNQPERLGRTPIHHARSG